MEDGKRLTSGLLKGSPLIFMRSGRSGKTVLYFQPQCEIMYRNRAEKGENIDESWIPGSAVLPVQRNTMALVERELLFL